jgi:hypothetical protein
MRHGICSFVVLLAATLVACAGVTAPPRDGNAPSAAKSVSPGACGARETASVSPQTPSAASLRVPKGFSIETIARIDAARELAPLPNGDLIVGTIGSDVYIVPNAEGTPSSPQVFAAIDDDKVAGAAFTVARCEIYVAGEHHVWSITYHGERKALHVRRIADVRTGPIAPGSDGDSSTPQPVLRVTRRWITAKSRAPRSIPLARRSP